MSSDCLSSSLLSSLLSWRNPCGSENNWIHDKCESYQSSPRIRKIVLVELGCFFLMSTAAIETIAYSILRVAMFPLCFVMPKPYALIVKKLESSSFTLLWGIVNSYFNFSKKSLFTNEALVRWYGDSLHTFSFRFARDSDRKIIEEQFPLLARNLRPYSQTAQYYEKQGSNFIKEYIFTTIDKETHEAICSFDETHFSFIVTKTIFEYVLGKQREAKLPLFLKRSTRRGIYALRVAMKNTNEEIVKKIQDSLSSFSTYQNCAIEQFLMLRKLEMLELQGSFYMMQCVSNACRDDK
jgi:hypothetical protein